MDKNIIFLAKFSAIFIILTWVIEAIDLSFIQIPLTQITAGMAGLDFQGTNIFANDGIFAITKFCTGILSSAILASIIFSLSKPELSKKAGIFLLGAIILFLANIIRVYFVLEIGKNYGIKMAETFHIISWFFTAAIIIIAWFYLTKKITKIENFSELL